MDEKKVTYGTVTSGAWVRRSKLPYKQTARLIQLMLTETLGLRTYSVETSDAGSCVTFFITRQGTDAGHIIACEDGFVYFRSPGFTSMFTGFDFDTLTLPPAIAPDAHVELPGDDELRRTFTRMARAIEKAIEKTEPDALPISAGDVFTRDDAEFKRAKAEQARALQIKDGKHWDEIETEVNAGVSIRTLQRWVKALK